MIIPIPQSLLNKKSARNRCKKTESILRSFYVLVLKKSFEFYYYKKIIYIWAIYLLAVTQTKYVLYYFGISFIVREQNN